MDPPLVVGRQLFWFRMNDRFVRIKSIPLVFLSHVINGTSGEDSFIVAEVIRMESFFFGAVFLLDVLDVGVDHGHILGEVHALGELEVCEDTDYIGRFKLQVSYPHGAVGKELIKASLLGLCEAHSCLDFTWEGFVNLFSGEDRQGVAPSLADPALVALNPTEIMKVPQVLLLLFFGESPFLLNEVVGQVFAAHHLAQDVDFLVILSGMTTFFSMGTERVTKLLVDLVLIFPVGDMSSVVPLVINFSGKVFACKSTI